MSVAEKIKTPNNEIIQPKKMGLLVENPVLLFLLTKPSNLLLLLLTTQKSVFNLLKY